jgi:hypothetical protein
MSATTGPPPPHAAAGAWKDVLIGALMLVWLLERLARLVLWVAKKTATATTRTEIPDPLPPPLAAAVDPPMQRGWRWWDILAAVLLVVCAMVAALVLTPNALLSEHAARGRLAASRPLNQWEQHAGSGLWFQWRQLGSDVVEGRVPVLSCAQWTAKNSVRLQQATLAPLPPLSAEAQVDLDRQQEEQRWRDDVRDARTKAAKRCIVHPATVLPTLASGADQQHLLRDSRGDSLADWARHGGTPLPDDEQEPVRAVVVAVLRNGSRYYPVRGTTRPPLATNNLTAPWSTGAALLSEDALRALARAWIARQNEHSGGGLKPEALDRCLCLPYAGVYGSGVQLWYDLRAAAWHVWPQARVARIVSAGCANQSLCCGAQAYTQYRATAWPSNVLKPLVEQHVLRQAACDDWDEATNTSVPRWGDVEHAASIVVSHYDLASAAAAAALSELEPGWVDPALTDVFPMATVFALAPPLARRETTLMDYRDSLCFAHCAAVEQSLEETELV